MTSSARALVRENVDVTKTTNALKSWRWRRGREAVRCDMCVVAEISDKSQDSDCRFDGDDVLAANFFVETAERYLAVEMSLKLSALRAQFLCQCPVLSEGSRP